ncbi:MAG: hypothetical protein IRY87_00760 [Acetobacteraceae bacterium]|nr:hypothetical protein [Acetobacteraceae bacterium]
MRRTILGLALLAPLFAAPTVMAQAQQGPDRKPEGNLGAGAAMTGAQRQSSGLPPTGGGAAAAPRTTSPKPGDPQAKPEGNLGAGAAMTGAERQSSGLPPTGGGMAAPMPQTTSPRNGSAATPSR